MTNYDENLTRRNFSSADNESGNDSNNAKMNAKNAAENIKESAERTLNENRDKALGGAESVAHAARAAAEDLRNQNQEGLSHYVTELADTVSKFAEKLRHKNVDELVHEVTDLARKNPALFIGGTIAIGLGIARFAKASAEREHTDDNLNLERGNQQNTRPEDNAEFKPQESLISGYTQPNGRSIGDSSSVQGSNNGIGSLGGTRHE